MEQAVPQAVTWTEALVTMGAVLLIALILFTVIAVKAHLREILHRQDLILNHMGVIITSAADWAKKEDIRRTAPTAPAAAPISAPVTTKATTKATAKATASAVEKTEPAGQTSDPSPGGKSFGNRKSEQAEAVVADKKPGMPDKFVKRQGPKYW